MQAYNSHFNFSRSQKHYTSCISETILPPFFVYISKLFSLYKLKNFIIILYDSCIQSTCAFLTSKATVNQYGFQITKIDFCILFSIDMLRTILSGTEQALVLVINFVVNDILFEVKYLKTNLGLLLV